MHAPLFSTHGEVLLVVATRPDARIREIATLVGVTERTVMHALNRLEQDGMLTVRRRGRRNTYFVSPGATCSVGDAKVGISRLVELVRDSHAP